MGLLIVMQEGWTALHYAADCGHVDVLHLLLIAEHCDVILSNKVSQQSFNMMHETSYYMLRLNYKYVVTALVVIVSRYENCCCTNTLYDLQLL